MFLKLNCIQVLKKKLQTYFTFVDGGKRIGASIFLEFLNWITMAWMRSILQKNNIEYNKSPDNRVTCLMYMKCFLEIYAI